MSMTARTQLKSDASRKNLCLGYVYVDRFTRDAEKQWIEKVTSDGDDTKLQTSAMCYRYV